MYRLTALWKVRMDRKCFSNVQQTFSGFHQIPLGFSPFEAIFAKIIFRVHFSTPPPVRIDPPQRSVGALIVTRLIKTKHARWIFSLRANQRCREHGVARARDYKTNDSCVIHYTLNYTRRYIYIFIAVIIIIIVTPYARACVSDMQTKRAGRRRIVMSARAELMSENNF